MAIPTPSPTRQAMMSSKGFIFFAQRSAAWRHRMRWRASPSIWRFILSPGRSYLRRRLVAGMRHRPGREAAPAGRQVRQRDEEDQRADDPVIPARIGYRHESQHPGRDEDPDAEQEVDPFLPELHPADGGQGDDEDDDAQHPGVPGRNAARRGAARRGGTAELQDPGRDEEPDGQDQIGPVLPAVAARRRDGIVGLRRHKDLRKKATALEKITDCRERSFRDAGASAGTTPLLITAAMPMRGTIQPAISFR